MDHIHNLPSLKVADLWTNSSISTPWRKWKETAQELHMAADCNLQLWKEMLQQRKIWFSSDPDILRWGYTPNGNFTLKEGYSLQENFQNNKREHIWTTIWKSKLWPKISTFLWLMVQNKILTWDNLRRRGFIGPSICHLCQLQEETMEHLLNHCPYNELIWTQAAQSMRRTNRERNNITNTLKNWGDGSYKSPNHFTSKK
jgi:hypothetical protein